jgi:hypothetical protein
METMNKLNDLACKFFREYALCEYCLKANGFLNSQSGLAKPDWMKFAKEVAKDICNPQSNELKEAIKYLLDDPPKEQVVRNGQLDWGKLELKDKTDTEKIMLSLSQIRHNLFHGGKFGLSVDRERTEKLLRHGLVILQECCQNHPKVRDAYDKSHW